LAEPAIASSVSGAPAGEHPTKAALAQPRQAASRTRFEIMVGTIMMAHRHHVRNRYRSRRQALPTLEFDIAN
jgi:hypothetical protein